MQLPAVPACLVASALHASHIHPSVTQFCRSSCCPSFAAPARSLQVLCNMAEQAQRGLLPGTLQEQVGQGVVMLAGAYACSYARVTVRGMASLLFGDVASTSAQSCGAALLSLL